MTISGNVGIGTTAPAVKLEVYGGHGDTKARLYSTGNGATLNASLDMWASEPGVTFDGSGIGNNINGHPYYGRRNSSLPQSYIRFYQGNIYFTTTPTQSTGASVTINTAGYVSMPGGHGDLAENYQVSGTVLRGGLVSVDNILAKTSIASSPTQSSLIGVVSTKPGAVMDVDGGFQVGYDTKSTYTNEKAPVALVGASPALVTSQNGSINIGDAIGVSTIPGFGAKMVTAGNIVGRALEKLDTGNVCQTASSIESIVWPEDDGKNSKKPCFKLPDGTYVGKIMVAVNVSWYDPRAEVSDLNEESAKEILTNVSNLLETAKEQQKEIEGLKIKNSELEKRIAKLESSWRFRPSEQK